jgi:hypothetical protein
LLALIVALNALNFANSGVIDDFRQLLGWMLPMIIGIFAVALPNFEYAHPVHNRWNGRRAELPLLALLPGLGANENLKRHVLLACLTRAWLLAPATWLILYVCSAALGLDLQAVMVYGTFAVVAGAGFATATVLGALGGRPLSNSILSGLLVALLLLAGLSLTLGVAYLHSAAPVLLGAWAVALGAVATLTMRGWQALRERPHPFLASAS